MQIVQDTLANLEFGPQVSVENLSMIPLVRAPNGLPRYLTLDEAISDGVAEVTEISEAGSVPELQFLNKGDRPILLLDGEELIGAKQNRVLNLSILAPAAKAIHIPVSCVEAGRWSRRTEKFGSTPRAQYAAGRARKMAQVSESLRTSEMRSSDQSEVWSDIDAKMGRLGADSPTASMSDMYDSYSDRLDSYVEGVTSVEGQVGAVFAINGKVVGLELFDHADTLRKLLPKIVRSYALDAIDVAVPQAVAPALEDAQSLLDECAVASADRFDAIGEGEDLRLQGTYLTGAGLVADGRIVHLCCFKGL